jgi:hypothetical protein
MARPLMCYAGYPMMEKEGMMEIVGICAVPTTAASAMVVEIKDKWEPFPTNDSTSRFNDPNNDKQVIFSFKSDGNLGLMHLFPVPIKTLRGIRAGTLTNTTQVQVYVR